MSAKFYQCVIFDWDGTIMNSEARIVDAIQTSAKQCGLPVLPYHDSKQIIGLSLDKAIEELYPELTADQISEMAGAYTQVFLNESHVDMLPFDGAGDMLKALRSAGVLTAVATGKSRKGLDAVLAETGFKDLFDITRTPIESESKPSPLMLQQILDRFDLEPSQAVMIGDTEFDMLMAQNIGMDRVALSHGVHELERLQKFSPIGCFDDLRSMTAWLLNNIAVYRSS